LLGESVSDICYCKKYEKKQESPKFIALGISEIYKYIILFNISRLYYKKFLLISNNTSIGTTSLFFISHKGELLSSLKFDSTLSNCCLYPVYKGI